MKSVVSTVVAGCAATFLMVGASLLHSGPTQANTLTEASCSSIEKVSCGVRCTVSGGKLECEVYCQVE